MQFHGYFLFDKWSCKLFSNNHGMSVTNDYVMADNQRVCSRHTDKVSIDR